MRLGMPVVGQPVAQGQSVAIDRDWYRFLRGLWTGLGFDHGAKMYDELAAQAMSWSNAGGFTLEAPTTHTRVASFASGADQYGSFELRLPNTYRPGTALKPWLDWGASSSAAGTVAWRFVYGVVGLNEAFPSETALSESAITPESTIGQRTEFDDIAGTGLAPGDVLLCAIKRAGTVDTYGTAVRAFAAGVKFEAVAVGHEEAHP